MKRGFRRNGMEASGLAIFAVVVLAVVGILLVEVGSVRGAASGKENPEIPRDAVGRVVAARQGWQSFEDSVAMSGAADVTTQIEPGVDATVDPASRPWERTGVGSIDRTGSYREAEALYNAGQYHEATEAFAVWTRDAPGDPWGHYMLGLSAWKSGEVVQAIAELRQAIALDPRHVKSYINLARVLLDAGRTWEGFEAIQEAVLRDAAAPGVQRVLGRCCHENDMPAEAEMAYKQAITQDPRDFWAFNNLGLLYIEQNRFDEALYALANAALVNDNIAEIQNNLGAALERTGHPLAATQAYARALEIDAAYERAQVSLIRVQSLAESVADEDVDLAVLAALFRPDVAEQPAVAGTPAGGTNARSGRLFAPSSLSGDMAR